MEILAILIPVSLTLGAVGLAAFFWALRSRQFEDPEGDSNMASAAASGVAKPRSATGTATTL